MESTGKEATRVVLGFLVSARHLERRFLPTRKPALVPGQSKLRILKQL
jgi:hypothetical protein